ncbi:unnamed protein product [Effrenium voratum]|nr:unnamed protein product [Effrenium voratum]
MPVPARSSTHVRGHSDREVLSRLEDLLRQRRESAEAKASGKVTPSSPRAWRPGGLRLDTQASLPLVATTPRGRGRGLEALARPRAPAEALDFLKALAKRFSKDPTLRRMLKQCLDGNPRPGLDSEYDLLVETKILKQASRDKTPHAAAGLLDGRLKLKDPAGLNEGSFQHWLNADSERAARFLNLLRGEGETTRKMLGLMWRRAKECLKRGARLGPCGPVVPRGKSEHDLPALFIVEDTFAQLCRKYSANQAYVRFGPYYLFRRVSEKDQKESFEGIDLGGAVVECPTRHANCQASSSGMGYEPKKALDTGWHPQITLPEFSSGGSWWQVDLGRLHSCTGVRLQWRLPQRKEVRYETRYALRSDLNLSGGLGEPILVTYVREGGPAWLAGVQLGDALQLDAGGDGDGTFLELAPMAALAKLQEESTLALTFVFQAAPSRAQAKHKVEVKLLAGKSEVGGDSWEQISKQELTISADKPCVVPGFFVARWVRLEFSAWPQVDGKALALSVQVVKVWRLAPPLFRQRFLEMLRRAERASVKASALPGPDRFWATAVHGQSFNMVINMDLVRRLKRGPDAANENEQQALEKMSRKDKKEFHILRTDEAVALRHRIFAKEEDVRECTFHPHTISERTDRADPDKEPGIKEFVKDLGENYEVRKYPNYWMVHRYAMLNKAKRLFVQGSLNASMEKLQRVQQILDRFRCFHKGCGRLLDQKVEICACSGFYCHTHKPHAVHNCKEMKKILTDKAREAKDLEIKLREEGENPPPEEKFDNKVELGLILEVRELAENISRAMQEKERQRNGLERLGQSLAAFGAVRLMERPFRRHMCQRALEKRRCWSSEGGSKTPVLGKWAKEACSCSKAHSPHELRFPAGESVHRRIAWVKEAVQEAAHKADVRPNSAAERHKMRKEKRIRPPPLPKSKGANRTSSEPRPARKLQKSLDDKAVGLKRSFGLCCEARVKLEASDVGEAQELVRQAKVLANESLLEVGSDQEGPGSPGARAFRDCEKQELTQMRTAIQQEAQEMLELCEMLEEEVQEEQGKLPPPPPPPRIMLNGSFKLEGDSKFEGAASPGCAGERLQVRKALEDDAALMRLLVNAADDIPPGSEAPKKREMCLDFLETGHCVMERDCPHAHFPEELQGHKSSWSLDFLSSSVQVRAPAKAGAGLAASQGLVSPSAKRW